MNHARLMSTTDRTPSVPVPSAPNATVPDALGSRVTAAASTVARGATQAGQATAFWAAALLPLTYLPMLASGGVSARPLLFAGLLAAHVAALVLGRDHATGDDPR
ncbi:hypothetical protein [Halobaculum marinum]|uniref:Uncharacterized protein n=1 Tax=Halobaculum marinum TaxID=3031996 RepID=A0ABD5WWJ7_9EURY|nr:hypothetical protein [Halobaculum sp. DT55]